MNDRVTRGILEFIGDLPPRVRTLRAAAAWDLNFGPRVEGEYPGFDKACIELRRWFHDEVPTLYFVAWVPEVTDVKPDDTEDGLDYSEIDSSTVKRALFGTLAEYI